MTEPIIDVDNELAVTSRRGFLRESGALMGGAVLGGLAGSEALAATAADDASNLPPNIPEWMKAPGAPMGDQLYGVPSPFEKDVIHNIPKNLKQYISASGPHAAAGSRRHHHAERAVLRAPSRRRARHRSRRSTG